MARSARGLESSEYGREVFHDACFAELTEYTSRTADACERIADALERLLAHPVAPQATSILRAPVQGDYKRGGRPPGTVLWGEHVEAWNEYAKRHGTQQSAQRIAERGGFGYDELTELLGHPPCTWKRRE